MEEDVRVREQTSFGEMMMNCALHMEERADVAVREVQCRVNLVEGVHQRGAR